MDDGCFALRSVAVRGTAVLAVEDERGGREGRREGGRRGGEEEGTGRRCRTRWRGCPCASQGLLRTSTTNGASWRGPDDAAQPALALRACGRVLEIDLYEVEGEPWQKIRVKILDGAFQAKPWPMFLAPL